MSFAGAVVLLALIAAFTYLRVQKYKTIGSRRDRERLANGSSEREAELEREVGQLKKRLAVLERIAIEEHESDQLTRQIESLRD